MNKASGFRASLKRGRPLLATFCLIPTAETVEIAAIAGFDVVILDQEHGPLEIGAVRTMILAATARKVHCIVRVRANDPALIGAALDLGADGVLVPQIGSVEAARRAVAAARFSPEGSRGANPWVRAADFGADEGWYASANARAAVLVMIEGASGAAAAADIMNVRGLDALFLGPVDFSHSLGVPGQVDHPKVVGRFEQLIAAAVAADVACSVFASTADSCSAWLARGARMVAFGCDTAHFLAGFKTARAAVEP